MTAPRFVELVGGPCDGTRLEVTGWDDEQLRTGVALAVNTGAYGPGGRSCYAPPAGNLTADRWQYEGDTA